MNGVDPTTEPGAYRRHLNAFFVYTAAKGLSFGTFGAVWVIYLQRQRGLSLSDAAIVDVSFFVIAAAAEIPTGVVADRYGRTLSVKIGAALMACGSLAWVAAPTLPLIVGAYVLLAVGYTFVSGAEDALLYETVAAAGDQSGYRRIAGRVMATTMGSLAAGSVLGGLLASQWLALPFVFAGVGHLVALAAVATVPEPHRTRAESGSPSTSGLATLVGALRLVASRPSIRWPIVYLAVIPVAGLIIETLLVQPQAVALGVPVAGLGVVVMGLMIAGTLGGLQADRIARGLGARWCYILGPTLIVAALVVMAASQTRLALSSLAMVSCATAAVQPVAFERIQDNVDDARRATVLSVRSLTFTAAGALTQPAVAAIADNHGLPGAYLSMAVITALAAGLVLPPLLRATEPPATELDHRPPTDTLTGAGT